jgi:CheY-like chemotaxis protein
MSESVSVGLPDAPEPTAPRALVLYIEDDAANVRLVGHILSEIDDVEFAAAASAENGLRLARQLHPSLVLLDLGLPDMSGEEVFLHLRALPGMRQVAVVIVSGDLSDTRRERLTESGVAAFLDKPYAIGDMIAIVKRLGSPATELADA